MKNVNAAGKTVREPGPPRTVKRFTPEQLLARKLRKALPKHYKRAEVAGIVTSLVGVALAVLRSAGVTDDRAITAVQMTARGIYGIGQQGGGSLSGLREEDTPCINFCGQTQDEDLPVLPLQGVQCAKGEDGTN